MELDLVGSDSPDGTVIEIGPGGAGLVEWAVVNERAEPVAVDRVRLRWRMRAVGEVAMFVNGWQSWSPTGGGRLVDHVDPSRTPGTPSLVRGIFHADATPAAAGEVRSELVTVLADDDGAVLVGFDGGDRHDGTVRVRGDTVVAEAFLGGAVLHPGERRELHRVTIDAGPPTAVLARWASWVGPRNGARTDAAYQVGWCSWYHYFERVTEADVRANLAAAGDWPLDVFQLDDGYQRAVGDWLATNESFPSGLGSLAADIAAAGYRPGLWLAPFLVAPAAVVAAAHPDWIARRPSGRALVGNVNPIWGGVVHTLDTTHPAVLAHLEDVARTLVEMGWTYLKLDFTYAPALDGAWHDPTLTPAQRVRSGYDAIRRGAGDDAFLLGCGAPLGPCIGVVDGMRIGPDVAPAWTPAPPDPTDPGAHGPLAGYADTVPATVNAWRSTLARSFMHRRLWLNDPDCLMLRTADTALTGDQVRAWARAVAVSGGMALVSDDLARLGPDARAVLDEVVRVGSAVDDRSRTGTNPTCPDLVDRWTPTRLDAGPVHLAGDPTRGHATLTTSRNRPEMGRST